MKRRWFQIHLSTAVVMMLVAGVFVGLNAIPQRMETIVSDEQGEYHGYFYGWPCEVCYALTDKARSFLYRSHTGGWSSEIERTLPIYLVMNLAACFGACAVIGALMEWRLRRKINDA